MKEFTGGDSIIVRPLYCEPFQFKPQFKLTLCCNHKPKIPSDDEGTWRRMSVLEYRSFRKNPDPANPYEFARDDQLSQKLIRWKEMFMVVLLEKYKQYKIAGLVEPPMVKNATLEYQKVVIFINSLSMIHLLKMLNPVLNLKNHMESLNHGIWII